MVEKMEEVLHEDVLDGNITYDEFFMYRDFVRRNKINMQDLLQQVGELVVGQIITGPDTNIDSDGDRKGKGGGRFSEDVMELNLRSLDCDYKVLLRKVRDQMPNWSDVISEIYWTPEIEFKIDGSTKLFLKLRINMYPDGTHANTSIIGVNHSW
jgi:hypothetical protein